MERIHPGGRDGGRPPVPGKSGGRHADGTADALPHIFEPFYRTDPSRSQQIPGSGLGLAVVRMIAALHGGTVEVTTQAGAGSAFTITFGANHAGN